ncbi:uncharacterized protein LOC102804468 [Saccoglossus kowalevskii]|uniref:Multiple epidermal growth factor-like domains protein 11-like n=1 Tax=Saccoglossus kowalevskii TaxID=10224 RepID=A0ABM0M1I1_SACKO|nr:PREDICTED: multiple epidermal growth factor-like domains protein 11-like [Saccoglossus kowalevskii]
MDSYVVCRVVALCTMLILFLPVSAAQIDPTGDNICRDPITRGYRCCDGFYPQGSLCVECDDNWYGPECALTCQCYNGAACHHVTGRCSCSGFWGGPHCTECKRQLYSSYCHPRCMHYINVTVLAFDLDINVTVLAFDLDINVTVLAFDLDINVTVLAFDLDINVTVLAFDLDIYVTVLAFDLDINVTVLAFDLDINVSPRL